MWINSFKVRRALRVLWIALAAALVLVATAAPSSALDPADSVATDRVSVAPHGSPVEPARGDIG